MNNSTWREKARSIVGQTIQKNRGKTDAELKQALFDAYPFGDRQYYPYKVWLEEVKNGMGQYRKLRGFVQSSLMSEAE